MTASEKEILTAQVQDISWAVGAERSMTELHIMVKALEVYLAVLVKYGK